jgi:hypothetical protein
MRLAMTMLSVEGGSRKVKIHVQEDLSITVSCNTDWYHRCNNLNKEGDMKVKSNVKAGQVVSVKVATQSIAQVAAAAASLAIVEISIGPPPE